MLNLLILQKIELINRPTAQTVAFQERVTAWMKQWTVPNNFPAYYIEDGDELTVLQAWGNSFVISFRTALSDIYTPKGIYEDFKFTWVRNPVETAKAIWLGDGAVHTCTLQDIANAAWADAEEDRKACLQKILRG